MATRAKDGEGQAPAPVVSMQQWTLFRLASEGLDQAATSRQVLYGQHGGADLSDAHHEHEERLTFPVPELGTALPNPVAHVEVLVRQRRRNAALVDVYRTRGRDHGALEALKRVA